MRMNEKCRKSFRCPTVRTGICNSDLAFRKNPSYIALPAPPPSSPKKKFAVYYCNAVWIMLSHQTSQINTWDYRERKKSKQKQKRRRRKRKRKRSFPVLLRISFSRKSFGICPNSHPGPPARESHRPQSHRPQKPKVIYNLTTSS